MEDRGDRRRRMRSPGLPGGEHLGGLRPRPAHREARDGPRDRVDAKREFRHDAEVPAATAAERPVEVGIALSARCPQPAVRGHDLGAQEVVGGQAELAAGETHAAAHRVAGDAHRRARAGGDRHPASRQRRVHVDQLRAGADRRRAVVRVDADTAQVAKVDDHPARQGRVAGVAVASRASPQRDAVCDAPAHGRADVGGVDGTRHEVRQHAVEALVVDMRGLQEPRGPAPDHLPADRWPGRLPRRASHPAGARSIREREARRARAREERPSIDRSVQSTSPFPLSGCDDPLRGVGRASRDPSLTSPRIHDWGRMR